VRNSIEVIAMTASPSFSLDPEHFNILHVEDEPGFARSSDQRYEGPLKRFVESALKYYPPTEIRWEVAPTLERALAAMATAERELPKRGFDALFCDLQIPGEGKTSEVNGFKVLQKRGEYNWPGAVVVLSSFAEDQDTLQMRARHDRINFDEWLNKTQDLVESNIPKLQRYLAPLHKLTRQLEEGDDPVFLSDRLMQKLLREIVHVAQRPITKWPCTKMLLLGQPGSGKNAVTRVFHSLLPKKSGRHGLLTQNCGSLVSLGEGARIRLFGSHDFQLIKDGEGVFEWATSYSTPPSKDGSPEYGIPDYTLAGTVFLDEFAELNPDIQASVLNALEEGFVVRAGSRAYSRANIGCNVVCATNMPLHELLSGKKGVRRDLWDRIPIVLEVPSLKERLDDEPNLLRELLPRMAARHLGLAADGYLDITVAQSVLEVLSVAVQKGQIESMRQLQSMAELWGTERAITDGNLRQVTRKLKLQGNEGVMSRGLDLKAMARELSLPNGLMDNDLPEDTAKAIEWAHSRDEGGKGAPPIDELEPQEVQQRAVLLSKFIPDSKIEQIFGFKLGSKRARLYRVTHKLNIPNERNEDGEGILRFLRDEDSAPGQPMAHTAQVHSVTQS
jgi:DNA-binding NtrC family response regulator